MNLNQIESEALALPVQDRAALAQRLLLSLDEIAESEFERVMGLVIAKPEAWKSVHPSGIRFINLSRFFLCLNKEKFFYG
jgi:hypothetical protein